MCKGASAAAVEAASDGGSDEERAAPKRRACCRTFLKVDGLPRPPRTVKHCQGAFCSLALGTAGLGALWAMFLRLLAPRPWARGALAAQTICSVAGLAPLTAFASKGFLHPKYLRVELDALEHPSGALVSSGAMAFAPLSRCLHAHGLEAAARWVWMGSYGVHVVLMLRLSAVAWRRRGDPRTLAHATPAWFVVYVGVAVYAAVATTMRVPESLVAFSLWLGVANLVWELPLVTYRLRTRERLPRAAYPTFAIYMAPSSLCCSAWLTHLRARRPGATFSDLGVVPAALTVVLAALACATAAPVFSRYKRFFVDEPVLPSWASFTFPTVIFANAVGRLNLLCPSARCLLAPLAWLLFANANLVVLAVWCGYVRMFLDGSLFVDYLDAARCLAYDDSVSPVATALVLLPGPRKPQWTEYSPPAIIPGGDAEDANAAVDFDGVSVVTPEDAPKGEPPAGVDVVPDA